jgi:hypothetical protein
MHGPLNVKSVWTVIVWILSESLGKLSVDFIAVDVNCDFMLFQFQWSLVLCHTTEWDSEYETGEDCF